MGDTAMISDEAQAVPLTQEKGLIEIFAEQLIKDLIPSHVLRHFTVSLSSSDKEHIRNEEQNHSPERATERLLQCVVDSKEPGAFREFVDALRNTQGYEHLAGLLTGDEEVDRMEPQGRLLLLLAPALAEDMDARTLCDRIPCLNQEDKDQIKSDDQMHGQMRAADTLLNRIVKHGPTWFHELLVALKEDAPHLWRLILGVPDKAGSDDELKAEKEFNAAIATEANIGQCNNATVENSNVTQSNDLSQLDGDDATELTMTDHNEMEDDVDVKKLLMDEFNVGDTNVPSTSEENDKSDTAGVHMINSDDDIVIDLRDYQVELSKSALNGENTIVSAPTGSGKTRIAANITLHHLRNHENGKVLLLVNKVPLVEQHFKKEFKLLTSKYNVSKICGESAAKITFKHLVQKNDVIILTAQILENALKNDEDNEKVELTDFSLLIFDECHHTQKGEVYNNIMHQYLVLKFEQQVNPLPQILGLTASLGVGGAKTEYKAVTHILQICANLDCRNLKTVKHQTKELEKHNKKAKKKKVPTATLR